MIRINKSKRKKWARHEASMGEKWYAHWFWESQKERDH
jgi:hypothetical protein